MPVYQADYSVRELSERTVIQSGTLDVFAPSVEEAKAAAQLKVYSDIVDTRLPDVRVEIPYIEQRELEVKFDYMPVVRINCPRWYKDPAFQQWLNTDPKLATWHPQGETPAEFSDVFMCWTSRFEASNYSGVENDPSSVPEHIWMELAERMEADGWGNKECLLWLSNLGD